MSQSTLAQRVGEGTDVPFVGDTDTVGDGADDDDVYVARLVTPP